MDASPSPGYLGVRMRPLLDHLVDLPFRSVLYGTSSLDIYHNRPESSTLYVYTEADLIELAKFFSALEYPGTENADARLIADEGAVLFCTIDDVSRPPILPFAPANLFYVPGERKYIDPYDVYSTVRDRRLVFADAPPILDSWLPYTELAVILSRYEFVEEDVTDHLIAVSQQINGASRFDPDDVDDQRRLLVELFESKNPKAGFQFLKRCGYIDVHWHDLSATYDVTHSKEHHPEGNVWDHILETFLYRKSPDLAISLGLLFHDSGKPFAQCVEGRMFDRHAQIGADIAYKFLRRLGFDRDLISQVVFLVKEHMLPAFIHKLPTYRTERVMASELFPHLLELYRCDLASTYRGPDGYYVACKAYRSYLKNVRNPFRTSDGKKILRRYVDR